MTNPTINAALQEASQSVTTDFQSWPKIPRLSKESMIITEKIDGTNAQILIMESGEIKAGSRNRWVTPEDDNYGFAKWVSENELELRKLGTGRHFGEWWGLGIQRNMDWIISGLVCLTRSARKSHSPLLFRRFP